MQKRQSSTSHSGLHSQNSALSWSQRQQLRRTSAAMRHASASRQLPHEENRVPPGWPLASLLALDNKVDDNSNNNNNNIMIREIKAEIKIKVEIKPTLPSL